MIGLPNWFNFEWFFFALGGCLSGFLIGGFVKLQIDRNIRTLPGAFRSWPIVLILLLLGAIFVVVLQDATRVSSIFSGFSLGFIVRKWWSD
jgi:hypothetical protein